MNIDTSPLTEARPLWRQSSRPSPATSSSVAFGIPKSAEEADKLLSYAERLFRDGGVTDEYISQLARFLGANSAAWTSANRGRLRTVLAGLGEAAIESVVATMSRLPRTDILDEGELVLRSLPRESVANLWRFLGPDQGDIAPSVKAVVLRAIARSAHPSLQVIHAALNDSEAEVRDAAASLLGELGGMASRPILQSRLARESDETVCASIREAIGSLQP